MEKIRFWTFLFTMMMGFTSLSGCLDSVLEQSDEGFECGGMPRLSAEGWDDHPDVTTDGTSDNLLRVVMDNTCNHPDDVLYVFASHPDCQTRTCVGINIEATDGTTYLCSTDSNADCIITEDDPDGVWEHNEWVTLTENGVGVYGEGDDGNENIEANHWPFPHGLAVI
jgi:hypothetical protein